MAAEVVERIIDNSVRDINNGKLFEFQFEFPTELLYSDEKILTEKLPKEFPFLFVSGADDPIGDFGKGVEKTTTQMQKDGFTDVKTKIYPAMRHEILNEDIKESIIKNQLDKFNEFKEWQLQEFIEPLLKDEFFLRVDIVVLYKNSKIDIYYSNKNEYC